MKNEKETSNLNFNVHLFGKPEKHFGLCFKSQLQYKNKNQNFVSNFAFQFILDKKKWHFRYMEWSPGQRHLFVFIYLY